VSRHADPLVGLLTSRRQPVQLAYAVTDVRAAAARWAASTGAGPFLVAEHVTLSNALHAGQPAVLDHSCALGAWGGVQVELFDVHRASPPSLAAAVATRRTGLHHVAWFVDDLDDERARLAAAGWDEVLTAEAAGSRFSFHAADDAGHLLEVYEPIGAIAAVYEATFAAAAGWDGKEPVRDMGSARRGRGQA
jgi:catechol 2,3-dioxygenase-like lactoylglutathione lyase family enzyme